MAGQVAGTAGQVGRNTHQKLLHADSPSTAKKQGRVKEPFQAEAFWEAEPPHPGESLDYWLRAEVRDGLPDQVRTAILAAWGAAWADDQETEPYHADADDLSGENGGSADD